MKMLILKSGTNESHNLTVSSGFDSDGEIEIEIDGSWCDAPQQVYLNRNQVSQLISYLKSIKEQSK